jgi:hypothetical protein
MAQAALTLISSSLRLIGVLAAGETLAIGDANDALAVLQDLIDSWNAERLTIFTTGSQDFPLVIGQQVYTLGPTGTFDTARPARIDQMSVILLQPNPSTPIELPVDMYSVTDWQQKVPVKNVNGTFPQVCYDDGGYPLRTLNMWPIPTQISNFRIYSWEALSSPVALSTSIAFPPGYAKALRFNLAADLAPEYSTSVPESVQAQAIQSLATLKTMNAPDMEMQSDLIPSPAGYNWKADMFGLPY